MTVTADLHVHTTASDGMLSPRNVVARASETGLSAVAVTDHDSAGGIAEALEAGAAYQVNVIPGIELSTECEDHEIHILGFYIDHTDTHLLSLLNDLQTSRFTRAEKMVEKLASLGYRIEMNAVLRHAGDAAPGRPHIGRALVEKGYLPSVTDAFESLIGFRMPAYVERFKLTPQQAIQAIHQAGGIAAWAHPGLVGDDSFLELFLSCGLDGLEAYHPDHSAAKSEYYRQLAKNKGLVICGGSDFHGGERARELGHCGLNKEEFTEFLTVSHSR
ncbi:MAG: PHP domain-containing protein [Bacillota bacterium]|nr:PHP domain-containing protein [Bacillota bacterium]MDW7684619.1 PHP domain-containing protein [Bacillota bacterium]